MFLPEHVSEPSLRHLLTIYFSNQDRLFILDALMLFISSSKIRFLDKTVQLVNVSINAIACSILHPRHGQVDDHICSSR